MSEGYQVVEPECLSALTASPHQVEFAVAVLYWLQQALRAELGSRLEGVDIDIIRVEYHGAYPALGLKYREKVPAIGRLVEDAANRLLRNRSVADLSDFIARTDRNWGQLSRDLMREYRVQRPLRDGHPGARCHIPDEPGGGEARPQGRGPQAPGPSPGRHVHPGRWAKAAVALG